MCETSVPTASLSTVSPKSHFVLTAFCAVLWKLTTRGILPLLLTGLVVNPGTGRIGVEVGVAVSPYPEDPPVPGNLSFSSELDVPPPKLPDPDPPELAS